jgi:hypothetical protein
MGAEQLLSAAGHGDAAIHEAVDAIVKAAEATVDAQRGPQHLPPAASAVEEPAADVEPEPEPEAVEPHDEPAPEPEAEAEAEDEPVDESTEDGGPSEDESPAPS